MHNVWWDYGGATVVEVNKYVRLTPDSSSKKGYLWTRSPFVSDSWIIEFDFKVDSTGSLTGDGFAFWYTTKPSKSGPAFGASASFSGLAIFFDHYPNSGSRNAFPAIVGMVNDGSKEYDHDTDGKLGETDSCQAEFRNKKMASKVKVTYVRSKGLKVSLNNAGRGRCR